MIFFLRMSVAKITKQLGFNANYSMINQFLT